LGKTDHELMLQEHESITCLYLGAETNGKPLDRFFVSIS
jgi:hypothetical protein